VWCYLQDKGKGEARVWREGKLLQTIDGCVDEWMNSV